MLRARWSLATLAASMIAGCGVILPSPFHLSRSEVEVEEQRIEAVTGPRFLPWASTEPYVIVVDKTERTLTVFHYGKEVRVFPVVLGRGQGRKLYEGDRRTPSGVYRISDKRSHARYHRFLDFDYPNPADIAHFQYALARGEVPQEGHVARPGALLGIHGSDKEDLNRVGVNWTYGCVALMNRDIEELYEMVPEGAVLLIQDAEKPW
jgi:murein L,D-transpeptidase YafK